jgi:hypothetical protein
VITAGLCTCCRSGLRIIPWSRRRLASPWKKSHELAQWASSTCMLYMAYISYLPVVITTSSFVLQIFALHITGSIDAVLSKEHIREICRHIYNHQVPTKATTTIFWQYYIVTPIYIV